jgi:beta-glucosidase
LTRVVEPGEVELWVGTSEVRDTEVSTTLVGDVFLVTTAAPRWTSSREIPGR